MNDFLSENLVDPIDKTPVQRYGDVFRSRSGRNYPIIQGIPVMLIDGIDQTIGLARRTLEVARDGNHHEDPWQLNTTGMGDDKISELDALVSRAAHECGIDPVINFLIGATSGLLYEKLVGRLKEYPIPDVQFSTAKNSNRSMLDIGCGWGRWSLSAARKGYSVVGLDPSLGAILAGRRAAEQMGLSVHWVVGDARFLPFKNCSFGQVFSYSVIQHFSEADAEKTLLEVSRVLLCGGVSLIQMPNMCGIRSLYHILRRGFREATGFQVRYYMPGELLKLFEQTIGPSKLKVDGFFGLGIQAADKKFMPPMHRAVIGASEFLRHSTGMFPFLKYVADSLFVEARKNAA